MNAFRFVGGYESAYDTFVLNRMLNGICLGDVILRRAKHAPLDGTDRSLVPSSSGHNPAQIGDLERAAMDIPLTLESGRDIQCIRLIQIPLRQR